MHYVVYLLLSNQVLIVIIASVLKIMYM